jgi:fatty acid-binding protein DegV
MARQDSELKALLDTDDINELERLEEITPDKEVFKLKKFWLRDYKDAVRDSEKDGDFTVVEPSIEEKISGKWNMFKSKVFAETPGDFDAIDSNDNDSEPEESQNMGFRSRKIAEYEDRLRQYSTPDKIFR